MLLQKNLFKLLNVLPSRYRNKLIYILFFLLLSAIFELLTLILLKPILSTFLNETAILFNQRSTYINFFNLKLSFTFLEILLGSIFLSTLSLITRFLTLKVVHKTSINIGSYLANRVLISILIKSENDDNRKFQTPDIITALSSIHIDHSISCINAQMQFINMVFITCLIIFGMIFIQPFITFCIITVLGIFFISTAFITKSRIHKNGITIKEKTEKYIKEVLTLFQIRENIRIKKSFSQISNKFNLFYSQNKQANHNNYLLTSAPRIVLDYLIFLAVPLCFLIIFVFSSSAVFFKSLLPSLILLGVALQRLLPVSNQIYRQWSRVKGFSPALIRVLDVVNISSEKDSYDFYQNAYYQKNIFLKKNSLKKQLLIKNVDFKNKEGNYILKNCNYLIEKGESICITGPSGSGKTTLLKLIAGLEKPYSGEILIDNKNINNSCSYNYSSKEILDLSYINQNNQLIPGTILENIIYFSSRKKIDWKKLDEIIEVTLSRVFIDKLPLGINQLVGDSSYYQLSGGEMQRIAIARSLYENSSMILMDESTNALDQNNEQKLISNIINYYEGTLIMVTHRESTIRLFDKNLYINNKSITPKII